MWNETIHHVTFEIKVIIHQAELLSCYRMPGMNAGFKNLLWSKPVYPGVEQFRHLPLL
jgi:hypothetical protein